MKRIIALLTIAFSMMFTLVSPVFAAQDRYWEVKIYDPVASSSNHSLNVEYKVLSTEATDTFAVKLLQNGSQVGSTQNVTHTYGNSGTFSVSLPENGTYSYRIVALNNGDSTTKETETKTVQIVNGPAPVVTTVYTNTGTQGTNAAGGAGGAGGGTAATQGGTVAGASTSNNNNGQVSKEGASSTNNTKKNGGVLGTQTTAKKINRNWWTIILAIIALLAVGYYVWFIRLGKKNPFVRKG